MPRFLIVDDSLTVRFGLVKALKNIGGPTAEVVEAATADEALALFGTSKPDVVFLDMQLGEDERGIVVMSKIHRLNPEARVVLVTGLPASDPEVIDAISRGAFAHIQKPVRTDALRRVLEEIEREDAGLGQIL